MAALCRCSAALCSSWNAVQQQLPGMQVRKAGNWHAKGVCVRMCGLHPKRSSWWCAASSSAMLNREAKPRAAWLTCQLYAGCGMVGIANAYAFVWIAQYYTDTKYQPVKQIAEASTTGHATNVIAGISIGLESTALPVLVMSAALISSYWLGNSSGGEPRPIYSHQAQSLGILA